jgi:aryl-alcohol dehydrogenase-like predicted oxidoreductase
MRYGTVKGVDRQVSRLVLGATSLDSDDPSKSFALLDRCSELGCTALETARKYGRGRNEALMGRWIRERGLRDRVAIITKGGFPGDDERSRVTPDEIAKDLDESLRQFGVDRIDLYLLHRDDVSQPVGPIVEALDGHRRAGKIAAFGASNWTSERVRAANAYAAAHGHAPFAAVSVHYSLLEPADVPAGPGTVTIAGARGRPDREWYAAENIALLAYSPLGYGFGSGRFRRNDLDSLVSEKDRYLLSVYGSDVNLDRIERAHVLARRLGVSAPQIMLAYAFAQPLDLFAICGCSRPEHFEDNARALDVVLSADEVAYLER